MSIQKIKFTAMLSAMLFLTAAFVCFASVNASAQILKPGEIIYSRLPTDINFPPRDANSPTIWAVGQDGSNDRQITTGTHPRISDDGRFLLFKRFTRHPTSFNPFGGYGDAFVRELATGQETLIFAWNFEQDSVGYYFSPESNQGNYEIIVDNNCFMYKSNRDGSNLFTFPWANASYCLDDFPSVRRGGDQLITFHNLTNDASNGGLYTVGIGGANRQKIANTNCGDLSPAWSNDSQFVAYGSLFELCSQNFPQITYPYFASNIFKIKPDGTSKQQVTNLTNTNCRLANTDCLTFGMVWTEDNSKIIAAGRINNVKGLFAFNANGSGAVSQIPISPGNAPDFVGGIVQPRVERQVLSFGGGVATNGNYTLVSTLGEPIAGQTSIGGSYNLESGFWAIPAETRKSSFDFDGDGKADVSVFRPSNGYWYLSQSTAGFSATPFGTNGDLIAPGDFDGDGKTDTAVFRPSIGYWYILNSSDGSFRATQFGQSGDIPSTGDYDGDGKSDHVVFRPSAGTFYLLYSSDNAFHFQQWGQVGDRPVMGDYDGDGKTDFAIFRPAIGTFYILRSSDQGVIGQQFGQTGDKPIAGDFDGDGKTDIAVYRPATGGWYYLQSSDNGFRGIAWGASGDIPSAGDYDGDGKCDVAVFRPSTGVFYILQSTNGSLRAEQFGANGDVPVPSAYVP